MRCSRARSPLWIHTAWTSLCDRWQWNSIARWEKRQKVSNDLFLGRFFITKEPWPVAKEKIGRKELYGKPLNWLSWDLGNWQRRSFLVKKGLIKPISHQRHIGPKSQVTICNDRPKVRVNCNSLRIFDQNYDEDLLKRQPTAGSPVVNYHRSDANARLFPRWPLEICVWPSD